MGFHYLIAMEAQHEVELKVLDINREEKERLLIDLKAEKIFDGVLRVTYFEPTPHLNVVRVRTEGDKTFLQVKHKIADTDDAKQNMEYSTEVSDHDELVKILRLMGHVVRDEFSKHRTSYSFQDCRIEFDKPQGKYSHIPEYLEVESDATEHIYRCLEQLDISKEKALPWHGKQVIDHYSEHSS